MDHHKKTISSFVKNLQAEEDMIDRLKTTLSKKKHFLMFQNLLTYFRQNFTKYKQKWKNTLDEFSTKIYHPLTYQFSKSSSLIPGIKQSKKAYLRLIDSLTNIKNSKISYHLSCKSFQDNFISQQILDDISNFYTPSKTKAISVKQSIRRAHEKMSGSKAKYEDCLKNYNMVATQIINRNSYAINSAIDYIIQSGTLIKQSCVKYLTEVFNGNEMEEGEKILWEKNYEELDKIDPILEVYSWVVAHTCVDKCPPKVIELEDFQSFLANNLMIKKNTDLNEIFLEVIDNVLISIWENPDEYKEEMIKEEKEISVELSQSLASQDFNQLEPEDITKSYIRSLERDKKPFFYKSNLGKKVAKRISPEVKAYLQKINLPESDYLNGICLMSNMLVCAWKGEQARGQDLDQFIDLLKHPLYFLTFPTLFQSFRKLNSFEISKNGFKSVSEMVMICLTECSNLLNVTVPLELVNMAGTYFMREPQASEAQRGKKVYLLEGIKSHKIFKNMEFWECCLMYMIAESKRSYDFHDVRYSVDANVVQNGFLSQIVNNFMTVAMHMKDFEADKEKVLELMNRYLNKYKVPDRAVGRLRTYMMSEFVESGTGGR
jgi:hypothetical protein